MSNSRSRTIAIGAVMTAFSLVAITLARFVSQLSITFNIITVIILLFLYSADMKKAMALCYIATSGLALILFNIAGGTSYVLFYGGYTLIACFTSKLPRKFLPLIYIGKVIYINGLIAIVLFVAKLIVMPQIIEFVTKNALNYILISVAVTVLILAYDYILVKVMPHVFTYLNKFVKLKKQSKRNGSEDNQNPPTNSNESNDFHNAFDDKYKTNDDINANGKYSDPFTNGEQNETNNKDNDDEDGDNKNA